MFLSTTIRAEMHSVWTVMLCTGVASLLLQLQTNNSDRVWQESSDHQKQRAQRILMKRCIKNGEFSKHNPYFFCNSKAKSFFLIILLLFLYNYQSSCFQFLKWCFQNVCPTNHPKWGATMKIRRKQKRKLVGDSFYFNHLTDSFSNTSLTLPTLLF